MSNKPSKTPQNPPSSSKTAQVKNEVDEVVGIMQTNIHKVIERGEQLDTLQNKTGSEY